MIQLEPLLDRVAIKGAEEAEETRSGLFIPDTAKEKPQQSDDIAKVGAVSANGDHAIGDLIALAITQPRASAASGR
jgi:co-chaperonin GroES (HSP10)